MTPQAQAIFTNAARTFLKAVVGVVTFGVVAVANGGSLNLPALKSASAAGIVAAAAILWHGLPVILGGVRNKWLSGKIALAERLERRLAATVAGSTSAPVVPLLPPVATPIVVQVPPVVEQPPVVPVDAPAVTPPVNAELPPVAVDPTPVFDPSQGV